MSAKAVVLLTFESIHRVLAAEKALLDARLAPDLVPVPKEISSDCGMAIAVPSADRSAALAALGPIRPKHILDHWRT